MKRTLDIVLEGERQAEILPPASLEFPAFTKFELPFIGERVLALWHVIDDYEFGRVVEVDTSKRETVYKVQLENEQLPMPFIYVTEIMRSHRFQK